MIEPLVVEGAKHRAELLAELLSMSGRQVCIKRFWRRPDFADCEMVRTADLLNNVETNVARLPGAVFGELFEDHRDIVLARWRDINVGHDPEGIR